MNKDHPRADCSSNRLEEQLDIGSLRARSLLLLAVCAGMRFSEILNLSLEQTQTVDQTPAGKDQGSDSDAETGPNSQTCQPKE